MNLSAAAIIKNGVKLNFPFEESIKSVLPLCDEFIIAVGDSDDGTKEKIISINSPKIKIIDTVWDSGRRFGGEVLSEQTNIAISECKGKWIFYIQMDEVVHEDDYEKINKAVAFASKNALCNGIAFNYIHFYGSYFTVQKGRNWYSKEIRIIRNNSGIVSHGDAQGFRKNSKKIRAIESGARIFHYGWARPPEAMAEKIKEFHKLWHDDLWIVKECSKKDAGEYFADLGSLGDFKGTHPSVMNGKVNRDSLDFIKNCKQSYLKHRNLKSRIRDIFRGINIARHRNFKILKEKRW